MKSLSILLGLMICMLLLQKVRAQETEEVDMVPFSPEYVFKDGIYYNIEAVKANDPIPFPRIVTDRYVYDKKFFDDLILNKEIVFYDEAGVRATIKTKEIWGYVLKGRHYIMVGGKFHRIILQGSVSQFMASESTNEKVYYDDEDSSSYTTTQDVYRRFYSERYYYRPLTSERELCLFDFESNTLSRYEPVALGKLLERDSVLYSEFQPLRHREKKKRMPEFIRRYNSRNPIYLPAE